MDELLNADDCQLVLIDYQARLMPAMHEVALVTANAIRLARMAQMLAVPCWGTEQVPEKLGANLPELRERCNQTLSKHHFDACEDGLLQLLRPPAPRQGGNARSLPRHLQQARQAQAQQDARNAVVIAGCEAHVCLLQTALHLLAEEFDVWVVTDACTSRTERNRDAAFDRLAGAGAELVTTEMVAFEWLRSSHHTSFKEIHSLLD